MGNPMNKSLINLTVAVVVGSILATAIINKSPLKQIVS
jgi:hypothetical protein